jgi:signal transduction histidine kinase
MFRSIRWRLVASFVLLTLLTVTLVGVLAVSLLQRYVEGQEREYLTANAEAVAQQAVAHLQPVRDQAKLEELARTASFLGNARVRILDENRQVLSDSGRQSSREQALWIMTSPGLGTPSPYMQLPGSVIVVPPVHIQADGRDQIDRVLEDLRLRGIVPLTFDTAEDILRELPPGSEFFVAERRVSPWGTRFFFGSWQQVNLVAKDGPAQTTPVAVARASEPVEAPPLRSARVVTVPIEAGAESLGFVELSKGPDVVAEAVATARRALLLAGGGTTLLAVVVGLVVSGWLTRPLQELTEAATEMSSTDLSIRAPVRRGDEIGQLAGQFNQMAMRLEESFSELAAERDTLRRFIADASHELRTPITALRNFNELLQGAAADDPEARQEFLAESGNQLERLAWITGNLLNLSRIEAGLVALDIAAHDAGDLIRAATSAFRPRAEEKGVALALTLPESPLAVQCDRHRIELALSNLLDNALKFTAPGGRVEVGAERDDRWVRLWVTDSGPGITPEDLPHVFDRFYRGQGKDGSALEGKGLGLAIVRGIAQAHGGQVSAASTPGRGSRFTLELPLEPDPQMRGAQSNSHL